MALRRDDYVPGEELKKKVGPLMMIMMIILI